MKTIGICFSGAIRTFDVCEKTIIDNIITPLKENFNIKLFGHFWILTNKENLENDMKWALDRTNSIERIKSLGFDKIVIEEYHNDQQKKIINELNYQFIMDDYQIRGKDFTDYAASAMSMYYKSHKSFELLQEYEKENNMRFDYCMRIRPDFYWNEPLLFKELNKGEIFIVKDKYCTNAKWEGNDKFWVLNRDDFEEFDKLIFKFKYFYDKGLRIEGQILNKEMIKDCKFKIIYFGSKNTYDKCCGSFISDKFSIPKRSVTDFLIKNYGN